MDLITVEEFLLAVGRDKSADKREQKHEDKHAHSDNGKAVAEESLRNHHSGSEYLYAAVVIERILRLIAVRILSGSLFLLRMILRRDIGGVVRAEL